MGIISSIGSKIGSVFSKPAPVVKGGESVRATPYTGPRSSESYGGPVTSIPSGTPQSIVSNVKPISSGRSGGSSVRTVSGGTSYLAEGATATPSSTELGGPTIMASEVGKIAGSGRPVTVVPQDASFTSGGSASGKGGSVYNPATYVSEPIKPQVIEKSYQPKAISAGGPLSSYAGTQKIGYLEATKQTLGNIAFNIGAVASGKDYITDVFSPFRQTGQEKSEATAYFKTTLPNTSPITTFDLSTMKISPASTYQPVSYLEVQKDIETANIKTGMEGQKLFGSKVTPETTQAELDVINKEYGQWQMQNIKPNVQGFTGRSGESIANLAPAVIETGALVGLTVANPIVGGAVSSAYVLGKSTEQFVTAPRNELGQLTAEGYLQRGFAVAGAGLGFVGMRASTFALEKSIVQGEVANLANQPIKFNQVQYNIAEDKSLVGFKATQKAGGLSRDITGYGTVIKEGETSFILPKGVTEIRTSGELGWNIYGPSKTILSSVERGTFGVKGFTTEIGGFDFTASRSVYQPQVKTSVLAGVKNGKLGLVSTDVKLFGDRTISGSLSSSKQTANDLLGNKRYFSVGVGVKGGKLVKPTQMGITTVIESKTPFSGDMVGGYVSESPFTVTQVPSTRLMKGFSPEVVSSISKQSVLNIPTSKVLSSSNIAKTVTGSFGGFGKTSTIQETKVKTSQISTHVLSSAYDLTQKQNYVTSIVSPSFSTSTLSKQIQIVSPVSYQPQETQQTQKMFTGFAPISGVGNIPVPFDFGKPFALPILPSMELTENRPSKKFKGRLKTKYTPSYEAILFDIRGKAPKDITGTKIRPLTKEFKSFKPNKLLGGFKLKW